MDLFNIYIFVSLIFIYKCYEQSELTHILLLWQYWFAPRTEIFIYILRKKKFQIYPQFTKISLHTLLLSLTAVQTGVYRYP